MTSIPQVATTGWLLRVTASAAPADSGRFEQQLQLLRPIAGFDLDSRVWTAWIGHLDVRALEILQQMYDAASRFGTEISLDPVAAPPTWQGPAFATESDLAALMDARANRNRVLGQLSIS
ncbi:hypothetical protein [Streptomyces sp. NPDC047525]|uniref:hypothetical protein n=1 Tax=Streptomyces sp. NPDC047525 TaxID=3155264 RepID=UPI0033FB14C4